MIIFFGIGVVMVGGVLAVLLWPLLRSSEQQADDRTVAAIRIYREQISELEADFRAGRMGEAEWVAAKGEIERRAVEDGVGQADGAKAYAGRASITAAALAAGIPVIVAGLYLVLGQPQALAPDGAGVTGAPHAVTVQQVEAMVSRLAARLEANPDDPDGWAMLARSYAAQGRANESLKAFERAVKMKPADAQLLADYADVLGLVNGRDLSGAPAALIERALKIDPSNVKALALSGTVAFRKGDFKKAAAQWRRAVENLPGESEFASALRASVAEAEAKTGGAVAAAKPSAPTAAQAGKSVEGRVSLAQGTVAGEQDFVFVFARAVEGPRIPLAVIKRKASELPFDFRLDDSMAMMPTQTLSSHPRVVIVARISKSGNPVAQPGDIEVVSDVVSPGAKGLRLQIAGKPG